MAEVVGAVRAGAGPVIVEAATYRWHGHYEGDPERYRTPAELEEWKERDPLVVHRRRLLDAGIAEHAIASLEESISGGPRRGHRDGARPGRARSRPRCSTSWRAPGPTTPSRRRLPPTHRSSARWTPIHDALEFELEHDDRVFVAGIDVGEGGNVFGLTRGLHDRFGPRVRDTPISETAIMGLGVGAAMAGMRPVVELMYLDFVGVCLDQLMNQAAKLPFMTGGAAEMALTIRTQFGAGRSSGSQHSQSLEALLAHIPGLTVVMPSTPADTYGLLRAAIEDPNPVIFIENRLLYGMKGPRPPADHIVPIGKSARRARRAPTSPWSPCPGWSTTRCAAAEDVAADGISVEVIDLRTVAPLDLVPILESVHKTESAPHRPRGGRAVRHRRRDRGDASGARRSGTSTPRSSGSGPPPPRRPTRPASKHAWLPDADDIAAAIRALAAI